MSFKSKAILVLFTMWLGYCGFMTYGIYQQAIKIKQTQEQLNDKVNRRR